MRPQTDSLINIGVGGFWGGFSSLEKRGVDLWEGRVTSGKSFWGSLGNFQGTSGVFLKSTVREVPGKSPWNFWRSSGKLPFESKLLPAVLLSLRIYFLKITVTITVLKFG